MLRLVSLVLVGDPKGSFFNLFGLSNIERALAFIGELSFRKTDYFGVKLILFLTFNLEGLFTFLTL